MTQTQAECEKMWGGKTCRQNPVGTWMIAPLAGYKTKAECEKATGKICAMDPRDTYLRWMTTELQTAGTVGVVPGVTKQPEPIVQPPLIYVQPPITPVAPVVQPLPLIVEPEVPPAVTPPVTKGLPWGYIVLGILILVGVILAGWYFWRRRKAVGSE